MARSHSWHDGDAHYARNAAALQSAHAKGFAGPDADPYMRKVQLLMDDRGIEQREAKQVLKAQQAEAAKKFKANFLSSSSSSQVQATSWPRNAKRAAAAAAAAPGPAYWALAAAAAAAATTPPRRKRRNRQRTR